MRSFKKLLTSSMIFCMLAVILLSAAPAAVQAKAREIVETSSYEYIYDESGVKTLIASTSYTYNKKGLLKKSTRKYDDEVYVTTYKYDKNGNMTSSVDTYNGEKQTKNITKYKKDNPAKDIYYTWDTNKNRWIKESYSTYKSTSKKNTTKYYSAKKVLQTTRVEKLNKKGYITSWKEYDTNKNTLYSGSSKYDKKGNVIKDIYSSFEGSNSYKITSSYKYNKKGLVTASTEHTVFNDGTVEDRNITYKYSKYYKKKKAWPQRILQYENGVLSEEIIRNYKTISY